MLRIVNEMGMYISIEIMKLVKSRIHTNLGNIESIEYPSPVAKIQLYIVITLKHTTIE